MLLKLADLLEENTDLLAAVESLDNGKSINMARGDVGAVVGAIRYYGGWADKIEGKTHDIDPGMFHYSRSEPVSPASTNPSVPGPSRSHSSLLTPSPSIRLVFAPRSFHGTSPCSCGRGSWVPRWRRAMWLCSSQPNKHRSPP